MGNQQIGVIQSPVRQTTRPYTRARDFLGLGLGNDNYGVFGGADVSSWAGELTPSPGGPAGVNGPNFIAPSAGEYCATDLDCKSIDSYLSTPTNIVYRCPDATCSGQTCNCGTSCAPNPEGVGCCSSVIQIGDLAFCAEPTPAPAAGYLRAPGPKPLPRPYNN